MSGQSQTTDTAANFVFARSRAASEVDVLLAQIPAEDPRKDVLRARARAYSQDCGCAMGGFFLAGALLLTLIYFGTTGELRFRTGVESVVFVFLAAGGGKMTGLLLASVKLVLLRRSLSRRVQQASPGHV